MQANQQSDDGNQAQPKSKLRQPGDDETQSQPDTLQTEPAATANEAYCDD